MKQNKTKKKKSASFGQFSGFRPSNVVTGTSGLPLDCQNPDYGCLKKNEQKKLITSLLQFMRSQFGSQPQKSEVWSTENTINNWFGGQKQSFRWHILTSII